MAPVFPTGVRVQGNTAVMFVSTIAIPTAPDLSSEINNATSLDISCYLIEGGWSPNTEASRITPQRRLCSKKNYEGFGITTESLGDLMYHYSPQAAAASNGKLAAEKLTEGTTGWFVERLGLDAQTATWAIGQFVNCIPVLLGPQTPLGDTSDEASEYHILQPVSIVSPGRTNNVAIVA